MRNTQARCSGRPAHAGWRLLRATARCLGHEGPLAGGAVCFRQYLGSSLLLTTPLHLLASEALWRVDCSVVPLPPSPDDDGPAILHRGLRLARKDFEGL